VKKKKSFFSKLHWTTKILLVYLIKKRVLILFFAQKMMEFCLFFLSCFWGPQKRPNFWILDLWVCLKKLGLEPDLYEKSVLYLCLTHCWAMKTIHSIFFWTILSFLEISEAEIHSYLVIKFFVQMPTSILFCHSLLFLHQMITFCLLLQNIEL
jgi:hypothetical protein